MHVSTRWLADYVDLPPAAELASMLSLSGLEVGSARTVGVEPIAGVRMEDPGPVWDSGKIVIGRVVSVGRHPDADKLKLPRVAFGNGREMTLVTGAPNIAPGDSGQWCVLALSGAKVIDGHSKEKVLKELKPTVIRGVPSEAMLCSAYELGLSEDHEGLLFLDPGTAPEGAPAADALGDVVLEIDILPNMARCLALTGLAREVAALTGGRVREPDSSVPAGAGACPVKVAIEAPEACRRYMGLVVEGFPGGVSSERVRRLLAQSGMRPIGAAVDITNFVMLEQGQPLHAFDLDKLEARAAGKPVEITVRYARAGETLTTLDGADRILAPDMLVIADASGPVALAGVMGGAATEVDSNTRRIFLESAHFDAVAIRRASR
ncbi:MAG: phenylalanine--tRNA ligase subunit beta, partial [Planctomycetota bacterium]